MMASNNPSDDFLPPSQISSAMAVALTLEVQLAVESNTMEMLFVVTNIGHRQKMESKHNTHEKLHFQSAARGTTRFCASCP
jgi:hypothetical protein